MMADEDASLTDHLQALLDNPKEISLRKEYKSSKLLHFFEFDYSDDLERARYLGNGSYGSVITGRNRVDKTVKAIKVMHTNDTDLDPKMKKNMEDEAKVFCRLDCDNIVRFFWVWLDKFLVGPNGMKLLCISMDYCQMDFGKLLLVEFQNEEKVLEYSKQMANGIAYLHGRREFTSHRDLKEIEELGHKVIMHHDLKPDNVLVKTHKEGDKWRHVLKIADFGLSRAAGDEKTIQRTAGFHTAFYDAPELTKAGKRNYTEAIDCYAVGKMLLVLLCLHLKSEPFEYLSEDPSAETLRTKRKQDYETITETADFQNDGDKLDILSDLCVLLQAKGWIEGEIVYSDVVAKLILDDPGVRLTCSEALTQIEGIQKKSEGVRGGG